MADRDAGSLRTPEAEPLGVRLCDAETLALQTIMRKAQKGSYEVTHDAERDFIKCRIFSDLSASDVSQLTIELGRAVAEARRRSPALRVLWDNQAGGMISDAVQKVLIDGLRSIYVPDDRVAILVASSLRKVRARKQADEQNEIFISESAAMTWLNAWS